MKKIALLFLLGGTALISCKSSVREPESQPEFFSTVPKFVKTFLKKISKEKLVDTGNSLNKYIDIDLRKVLSWVAEHGEYSILKKVIKGAKKHGLSEVLKENLDKALYLAVKSPYPDGKKINYLIEQGADLNSALRFPAEKGDLDGVRLLIVRGATDLDHALSSAIGRNVIRIGNKKLAVRRKMEIIPALIKMGANPNLGMMEEIRRISGGDLKVVKRLVELGADDFDEGLRVAAIAGKIDIAKYMVAKGATDFNTALEFALDEPEMVRYLLERGATNIREMWGRAAEKLGVIKNPATPREINNVKNWTEVHRILREALQH